MSEVKVNKISPRTACGTTTLGDSGDTFNVPCGSKINLASGGNLTVASGATITNNGTQTGFGRTGTVDWVTTPKVTGDSPVTGVSGNGYFLNTTAGAITLNLPAGSAGDIISLADYAGTWQNYPVTVTPNGSEKIGGINASVGVATEGQSVTFVYVDSTQGWVNTMDSTSNVRASAFIGATGGCISTCGDCKVHKFTGPGTFNVVSVSPSAPENVVSYMVVAGGGGGGWKCGGGGGGAGGFREDKSPVTPYTASPLDGAGAITVSVSPYPIGVGGGGAAAPANATDGTQGVNSTFSTITSTGGGFGNGNPAGGGGGNGGSGGGGGNACTPAGSGNTPPVSPAQGFDGGNGNAGGGSYEETGGGGGGSTAVGANSSPNAAGGNGCNGVTTSISGTPTAYGGGGGGGTGGAHGSPVGAGGSGGGGAGGNCQSGIVGVAGTCNTGGGGGGGAGGDAAAAGGSGIVIIRYKFQ